MQYATLPHVAASDMIPGDLVFFGYAGRISHMGMYIGGGRFVHAPHTGDVVKVSALAGYYQAHFIGAARP
jgi:cell wall-associated NlpC family hydrolase